MTALRSFFSARISSCNDSNPRTSSSVYSYVLTRLSSSKRVDMCKRSLASLRPSHSVVMTPHAENSHGPLVRIDLVDQTMLPIDTPRVEAGKLTDELLKGRRRSIRIVSQNCEKLFDLFFKSGL